jgi:hypothetical protein
LSTVLLPTLPDKRSIVARLNDSIKAAEAFYGAVCFWSIGPDILDSYLVKLLGQSHSFCIVDIHTPTNVDKLHDFYKQGGTNFHIFAKEIQLKTGERFLQRHLLHIKMLVFDLPGNQAEIWVGSHNFTKQALYGINREATMILPCQQGDPLYQQARGYLASVLADPDCQPFDPARLDDYKKLQGLPEEEVEVGCYVLPLAWDSTRMPTLAYQTVTLVGKDEEEGRQLFRYNGENVPLAIRAYDLASNSIRHFAAIVQNQGTIDAHVKSSYDLVFGPRHLAVRPPRVMPYVAPLEAPLTSTQLLGYRFWATVRILDELPADLDWEPIQRTSIAEWEYDSEVSHELYAEELVQEPPYDFTSSSSYLASIPPNDSFDEAGTRTRHWLDWVTRRTSRKSPGPPDGRHALFSAQRNPKPTPTELDKIDDQFRPANREQLLLDYERPMRETFDKQAAPDQQFKARQVPRLVDLLKRYRLKPESLAAWASM